MTKKRGQTQVELTNNKNDKHPFRKKEQKATENGLFKVKNLPNLLRLSENHAVKLALKIANTQTRKLRKALGFEGK